MSKLTDAIAYLRSRNLYATDRGNKLKYKSWADVAKTATAEERRLKELDKPAPNVMPIRKTK